MTKKKSVTLIDNTDGPFKVSQSKVRTWRTCRRQYSYKYVEKIRKRIKSRPLVFGTIVHSLIEADANGDDPMEKLDEIDVANLKLFQSQKEQYGELIEDIRCIMTDYFDHWEKSKKRIIYSRRKGRSAEHNFEIAVADGILFTGKIDAVGKSRDMRWAIEHKTFKRMPNEDDRWKSVQSAVYIRAIQIMGWWNDLEGMLWDYVASKPPAAPAVLQSGKISQAKLDSVPSRVREFLRAVGADETEYKKLLDQVTENRDNRFLRVYTPLNENVVEDTWKDFIDTAIEMQTLHGKAKQRTIGQHCSWCDYEKLCRGEVTGLDLDFIRKREYTYEKEDPIDGREEN